MAGGDPSLRFLGPRAFQAKTQATTALSGALAAMRDMQRSRLGIPLPLGMDAVGDPTALLAQAGVVTPPPAPAAPGTTPMLGIPPLPGGLSSLPTPMAAPQSVPNMPSLPPAPGMPPVRAAQGGVIGAVPQAEPVVLGAGASSAPPAPSTAPQAAGTPPGVPPVQTDASGRPLPGALFPTRGMMPEDDQLLPGVVPASKLMPMIAALLQQQRRQGGLPSEVVSKAAQQVGITLPADPNAPIALRSEPRPSPQEQDVESEADYIVRTMSGPPPPEEFTSWLKTANPQGMTDAGLAVLDAYRANPALLPTIYAAARDLAQESPADFPPNLRRLLTGGQ